VERDIKCTTLDIPESVKENPISGYQKNFLEKVVESRSAKFMTSSDSCKDSSSPRREKIHKNRASEPPLGS
jgi:hypothetical protein